MNHLPTVCVLVATRCQYQWEGPQVNKFEQVSSDGHQMSLVGTVRSSEVQCIMGNGDMGSPSGQTD